MNPHVLPDIVYIRSSQPCLKVSALRVAIFKNILVQMLPLLHT